MTSLEKRMRLFVYEFFIENDRCPTLNEIADEARETPVSAAAVLERLARVYEAIVLSPGSSNIWLADPFAALPTPYPVYAGDNQWFGMCVWDALGILAVTRRGGRVPTLCPTSGTRLELIVESGDLIRGDGVVRFAVPAAAWWHDIGFT